MTIKIKENKKDDIEAFDYIHPLGILTLVLDHVNKELVMVSFTPCQDVKHEEVKSVDWFFKDGQNTGCGTGQEGWEWKLNKR